MLPSKFDIHYCWRAFLRRKWYVAVPFFLILAGGIGYALSQPKMYMSSANILAQHSTLRYIRITADMRQRINTIKARITRRSNLEDLIDQFRLYPSDDPSRPEMSMEKKAATMRTRIGIQVPAKSQYFKLSFTHKNPQKAMEVTNALVLDFIQEEQRQKLDEVVGNTEFLENELQRVEKILQEKEMALTTYKQKHLGGLPDQLSMNLTVRGQILQEIDRIERSLEQAQSKKFMLHRQINNQESNTGFNPTTSSDISADINTAPDLLILKQNLSDLRLRYTENHPDVIRLKKKLARLEGEQKVASLDKQKRVGDNVLSTDEEFPDSQLNAFKLEMATINHKIKKLQADKEKLERDNKRLDGLIANAPIRKLDLINLERDYNGIRQQYNSLLARKLDSDLVTSMEQQKKGTRFRVSSPAGLPRKPISPNIPRMVLLFAIAGLAVGLGLGLGMEFIDQSFRDLNDLHEVFQLEVLAVIPKLKTTAATSKKSRRMMIALCLTSFLLVAVCIGVWLWMNGNLQELVNKIRSLAPI